MEARVLLFVLNELIFELMPPQLNIPRVCFGGEVSFTAVPVFVSSIFGSNEASARAVVSLRFSLKLKNVFA